MERAENSVETVTYLLNGKMVTRIKTGFSKNNLLTDKYAKVKENSSEFGHCSKLGKVIRDEISELIQDCGDRFLYQKFAQLLTRIKDLDKTATKGKRTVQNGILQPEAEVLLRKFKFGELENVENAAVRNPGFFTIPVILDKSDVNKAILITLKIDYKNYAISRKTQLLKVSNRSTALDFDIFFPEESPENLMYLLALYKDDNLLNFGFL